MDDLAAVLACAGADVHHMVGRADGFFVVLHDHDGVAEVSQAGERLQQAGVVALVQTDGRFVQHIEHSHQPAADLRCQADALRFAARKRAGRTGERQISQPHIHQKLQAQVGFFEHTLGD